MVHSYSALHAGKTQDATYNVRKKVGVHSAYDVHEGVLVST